MNNEYMNNAINEKSMQETIRVVDEAGDWFQSSSNDLWEFVEDELVRDEFAVGNNQFILSLDA